MNALKTRKEVKTTDTEAKILGACNIAKYFEDSGEYEAAAQAMGNWWQGIGKRPNLKSLSDQEKALILSRIGALSGWLGSAKQVTGSQETAKDLISESATLFEKVGDTQNWADARSDLAICYWREGAYDEARIILQDVLGSEIDFLPELRGKILLRSVNVEISTHHYRKALELVTEATPLIEKKGGHLLRGKLYFHRALILRKEGEDENRADLLASAVDDYRLARLHYKKAKHDPYVAMVENNIGNVYRLLKDFQNAHLHLDNALKMYGKLKDKGRGALVYENKARVFLAQDNLAKAETAARESVRMVRGGDESSVLSESLNTLGTVLSRQENFAEAKRSFIEAKKAAVSVGDTESAGTAVLTQIEELQSTLTSDEFRALYLEADELLRQSPRPATIDRLQRVAKKQLEISDNAVSEISTDSQKMAKLLSYADKLDSLFENEVSQPDFSWENFSLPEAVLTYEGEIILKAINDSNGRVTKAAQLLGLSHQNLSLILHQRHKELKKHCVQRKPRSKPLLKTH